MRAPRHLAVLLASGLMALAPAVPAFAQSGGDGPSSTVTAPPLTEDPQTSGGSGSGSSGSGSEGSGSSGSGSEGSGSGSSGSGGAAGSPAQLPITGADLPVVAFLGLALMLLGIGLRLRIADARP